jgi:hypothetical protein
LNSVWAICEKRSAANPLRPPEKKPAPKKRGQPKFWTPSWRCRFRKMSPIRPVPALFRWAIRASDEKFAADLPSEVALRNAPRGPGPTFLQLLRESSFRQFAVAMVGRSPRAVRDPRARREHRLLHGSCRQCRHQIDLTAPTPRTVTAPEEEVTRFVRRVLSKSGRHAWKHGRRAPRVQALDAETCKPLVPDRSQRPTPPATYAPSC